MFYKILSATYNIILAVFSINILVNFYWLYEQKINHYEIYHFCFEILLGSMAFKDLIERCIDKKLYEIPWDGKFNSRINSEGFSWAILPLIFSITIFVALNITEKIERPDIKKIEMKVIQVSQTTGRKISYSKAHYILKSSNVTLKVDKHFLDNSLPFIATQNSCVIMEFKSYKFTYVTVAAWGCENIKK
jgi:hypothetical protein